MGADATANRNNELNLWQNILLDPNTEILEKTVSPLSQGAKKHKLPARQRVVLKLAPRQTTFQSQDFDASGFGGRSGVR